MIWAGLLLLYFGSVMPLRTYGEYICLKFNAQELHGKGFMAMFLFASHGCNRLDSLSLLLKAAPRVSKAHCPQKWSWLRALLMKVAASPTHGKHKPSRFGGGVVQSFSCLYWTLQFKQSIQRKVRIFGKTAVFQE